MARTSRTHVKTIVKHDNGELGQDVRPAKQWVAGEQRIEAELLGTFPASDPPSHWAGEEVPGTGQADGVDPDRVLDISEVELTGADDDLDPPSPGQLPRNAD